MVKKILILASNPKDTFRLRLDQEVREIDQGLSRAKKRKQFSLIQQWAPRPKDVRRAMLDSKPSIVHFCGHGAGINGIAFEDETGLAKMVNANALAGLFELFADTVECVVLNACYSQIQAEAIGKHIRYVVGMKEEIGDIAAIEFAVAFYDAIGAGEPVEFAYKLACNAIRIEGISDDLVPILLSNATLKEQVDKVDKEEQAPRTVSEYSDDQVKESENTVLNHNSWIEVGELIKFNELVFPCIMCEGDGEGIFDQSSIKCFYADITEYPQDIKSLINDVQIAEDERHRRGEKYAWNGQGFGLQKWFANRAGVSETPTLNLFLKPTNYYEFLATNMILDEKCVFDSSGHATSLRAKYAPKLVWNKPVIEFSNQLGVVISTITQDGYWIAIKRAEGLRLVPETYQSSIGEAMTRLDQDVIGNPDVFKTVSRGAMEELGVKIKESDIEFLGLICDVNFYQYDLIGKIDLDISSKEIIAHRSLGAKDSRFESEQQFLVQYDPHTIALFIKEHQPWWPRALVSVLYCLVHDFGIKIVSRALKNAGLTRVNFRYH